MRPASTEAEATILLKLKETELPLWSFHRFLIIHARHSHLPRFEHCGMDGMDRRVDAYGERALVEILQWSGLYTGPGGSAFEQTFQIYGCSP